MSFFITLIEQSDENRRAIESTARVQQMMRSGLSLPEYRGFLHDLYHIVLNFCPVMQAAAPRCGDSLAAVRRELEERISEEAGHEEWVMEDVRAVGGNPDHVRATPPSPPVQAMIAFNHHSAERGHPASVLGMLYVLEVIASVYGGKAADSIARAIGKEPTAAGGFRFLSSHATMDAHHMAQLNVLLKTITDPAAQSAVINSTRVNFHQFGQLFGDGGFVSHLRLT